MANRKGYLHSETANVTATTISTQKGIDANVETDQVVAGTVASDLTAQKLVKAEESGTVDFITSTVTSLVAVVYTSPEPFVYMPVSNATIQGLYYQLRNLFAPKRYILSGASAFSTVNYQFLGGNTLSYDGLFFPIGINYVRQFQIFVSSGTFFVQCEYIDSTGNLAISEPNTVNSSSSTIRLANAININRLFFYGDSSSGIYQNQKVTSANIFCRDSDTGVYRNSITSSQMLNGIITVPLGYKGNITSVYYNYDTSVDILILIVVDRYNSRKFQINFDPVVNTTINRIQHLNIPLDELDSVYFVGRNTSVGSREVSASILLYSV